MLDGILVLLAATVAARFAIAGLRMLGAAALLIASRGGLRRGSPETRTRTRTLASYGVIAVGLIILMSSGGRAASVIVPQPALVGGTVGLTAPTSSKTHFWDVFAVP